MKKYIFIIICLSCGTLYGISLNIINRDDGVKTVMVADSSRKGETKHEDKWNIFPNPVEDMLYITGLEGNYAIKIVDTVGQVVATFKGAASELEIDMSARAVGMYLIKIESQGKSITRKVVKK